MERRKGPDRARQAGGASAHARRLAATAPRREPSPYAMGEDVTTVAAPAPHTPGAARRAPDRQGLARRPPVRLTAQRRQSGADDALIPDEARGSRWRQPNPRMVAQARLTRAIRTGARDATRQLGRLRAIPLRRAVSATAPLSLLIALLLWMFASSYWQTRMVRVEGTSNPILLALVRAQRLTGCNAFRCDFSVAQQTIAASPLAQRVKITIVYPDTTLVSITPRQTATLWRTQGQTWAVGADGVVTDSIEREPALASTTAPLVDDPSDVAFAGRTPQPGARMSATMVAMASQLRSSASSARLDPASLRYSATDGFTMRATVSGALVIFGSPADAQAVLADLSGSSPMSTVSYSAPGAPAQVSQGARLQVEVAAAMLARIAQSGVSVSLIDVRWGSHPYYR